MVGTPTTTGRRPSPLVDRLSERARIVALALFLLGIELVLALSLVSDRFAPALLLFAAAGAAAFVLRFPIATALVLLGLTDFVFHGGFFAFSLGPIDARAYQLALAGLLVLALVRPRRDTWGGTAGVALAVFLAVVGASGAIAILVGRVGVGDVVSWGRALSLLTVFYVVVRLFPEPHERRLLLTGAAALAAATGVVAALISVGAVAPGALLEGNNVRTEEGLESIQRVRLPGLSAAYVLFWYVAIQILAARGRARLAWAVVFAGIALNIAVSFNRNMWTGLVLGLVLMLIVAGPAVRARLGGALGLAVAAALAIALLGLSTQESQVLGPVIERGSSLLDPGEVSQEGSFRDRAYETEVALDTIGDNLVLGIGPGAEFGLYVDQRVGPGSFQRLPQVFLHNQYLYLLLVGGLPALIAFLVFLGSALRLAFMRRAHDPAIAACGVGIALLMISSIVAIYFTTSDTTTMLGLLVGVIVADAEGPAREGLDSGLGAGQRGQSP